jgi:hypothetical protein
MRKSMLFTTPTNNNKVDIVKHTYNSLDKANVVATPTKSISPFSNIHPHKLFFKPITTQSRPRSNNNNTTNYQMKLRIAKNETPIEETVFLSANAITNIIIIPNDYCFHFDPMLPMTELIESWALIENTNGENLEYSKEPVSDYINIDTDFYFKCSGKMMMYRPPLDFTINDMTLISVIILQNDIPARFPHILTMFCESQKEGGILLENDNILFQLFNDIISSSFHMNTPTDEIWSDHSLPIDEAITFTVHIKNDLYNENVECFYRVNGIQIEFEYVNHNGFIGEVDAPAPTPTPTTDKVGTGSRHVNRIVLGGNNIDNGGWMGYIGETYFYNRALGVSEISDIEKKLSMKWDVE